MSSYDEMLEKDTLLLWSILDFIRSKPWLDSTFSKIISKKPWQDIVLILWFIFGLGLFEVGSAHLWVASMNFVVALVARTVIEAKRPLEIDRRLQPLTDSSVNSYGFPSLESYMSVVILGDLVLRLQSIALVPFAIAVIVVVGVSRLYSRSRFPHQIVGSWILGVVGLYLSRNCCDSLQMHQMSDHQHGVCIGVLVFMGLAYMAYAIENNDSRLMYIPKKEFVSVIAGIIESSNESYQRKARENIDMDGDFTGKLSEIYQQQSNSTRRRRGAASNNRSNSIAPSPRALAARKAQMRGSGEDDRDEIPYRRAKRDSFYFMQRAMEARSEYYKSLKNQGTTTTAKPFLPGAEAYSELRPGVLGVIESSLSAFGVGVLSDKSKLKAKTKKSRESEDKMEGGVRSAVTPAMMEGNMAYSSNESSSGSPRYRDDDLTSDADS